MASSDGLYWFHDGPDVVAQKLSAGIERLEPEVGRIVSEATDAAVEMMRRRVMTGGVKDGHDTGGPRIDTGRMYSSIAGTVKINGRGRVQAEFGYILDPPYWTVFQEFGTRGRHGNRDNHVNPRYELHGGAGGIKPLHGFVEASELLQRALPAKLETINIWRGIR